MDAQVAPFAHRIGIAALERLIAEAIARFMPEKAAEDAERSADGRHFTIDHQQVSFGGTSQITGELDLADALDLDAALAEGRQELLRAGVDRLPRRTPLHRRRPARPQPARPRPRHRRDDGSGRPPDPPAPKPRQVVLHVHLSETAITGNGGCLELARVENQRRILTADQIRTWCATPDTEVIVKPVIDLNEHIHVEGYEVPDRLREQATLRDHTCVFPWCTRSARKTDADHVIPHADGGTTSSDNIAPLCRRHHRLKTHTVLDLHDARTRIVPLVEPARLPVPARPPRHPRRQPRPASALRAPHRAWSRLTAHVSPRGAVSVDRMSSWMSSSSVLCSISSRSKSAAPRKTGSDPV